MYRNDSPKDPKNNHNFIKPKHIYFSDPPPPPHKNEIQNFETPKMDRTYLYKIILEYNPSPPPHYHHPPRNVARDLRALCTKV